MLAGWIGAGGLGDEAVDAGDRGIRSLRQDDTARGLSCRDGAGSAVVGAVQADRAVLSEARQWPPAGRGRADAAPLFPATLVQSVRPGSGRGALRFAGDAAFCWHRPWLRAGAGRDDGVSVPPPARGALSGPA